ncbi:MAG: hypothetical protein DHS20C21_20590 [Gemmatimonadota bacterium]|nr:MAG: hypothetical protein DHS20C21_20590 [Gemmatimonadota bacterium]
MLNFLERLGTLDRRWIFLFIAVSVTIPLLLRRPAPVIPSPIVQDLYDSVEALPAGSRVVLSLDYGPSTVPENDPMAHAVTRHALKRDLKLYVMTIWATGPPLIANVMQNVIASDFPDKKYGEDFLNLGYKVGNQGLIQSLTSDFKGQYTSDIGYGDEFPSRPTSELEMMAPITTIADFDMVIAIGSGYPGVKEWVQFAGDPTGVPVGGGVTAVEAPLLYPYYPTQLRGLMGGLQGAAEYERLVTDAYPEFAVQAKQALIRMFPQTWAHLVIIGFVVLGNISYFTQKRRARK